MYRPVLLSHAALTDNTSLQCLVHTSSRPPTDILRLLQDICSRSSELPTSYWLDGVEVHWRDYIAGGGEACIYPGTLGDLRVVIREVSKPENSTWTSLAGNRITEVSDCYRDMTGKCCLSPGRS